MLGAAEAVEQFYTDDGHAIPQPSQDKMVSFFRKALLGDVKGEVKPYTLSLSAQLRGSVSCACHREDSIGSHQAI